MGSGAMLQLPFLDMAAGLWSIPIKRGAGHLDISKHAHEGPHYGTGNTEATRLAGRPPDPLFVSSKTEHPRECKHTD